MRLLLVLALTLAPADLLRRAEAAFGEGIQHLDSPEQARAAFREAAARYDELVRSGIENPDLFRNLGRSYLLAGDLPPAILAFRRGLRLSPRDQDLSAALAWARQEVVFPENSQLGRVTEGGLLSWLRDTQPILALALGFILVSASCLGGCRWLRTRRTGWLVFGATALLLTSGPLAVLLLAQTRQPRESRQTLVVLARDGVRLRTGNGESYPTRFDTPLNRGVEAVLLFQRGDWFQIELAGGEVGWIARTEAIVDRPGSP